MLQRAASNAYSWWWAGHIRTKQSKWMEQSLQDMEEKVTAVLKVIEEDGDSFAKRAEMYYKKRPELIEFVEEFYRAYRALAERYDHISKELQNANNTLASVCPEQAQFTMDDEEEDDSPTFSKKHPLNSKGNVPDLLAKDLKGLITSATNKREPKRPMKAAANAVPKSGLTKANGLEEIHRLQKRILALQTEKEFVKGSYESGLAKYREIDDEIKKLQEKVYSLQDEFGEGRVIEDDDARTMMVATALQSCKETLTQMQEKQERSVLEAEVELRKIKDAREKLDSLKNKFLLNEASQVQPSDGDKSGIVKEKSNILEQEVRDTTQKKKDTESLTQKIKEQFEIGLSESLTVTEMVEKVDELVNKVVSLENAISSQTALLQRLRAETDELQSQIQTLEEDKAILVDGKSDLKHKLMEMEDKFHGILDLNQNFQDHNNNLQTHFTEAHCNLDCLSEKVHSMNPDEEEFEREKNSLVEAKSSKEEEIKGNDKMPTEVKAGQEFVVANASERDNSPAEVKSTRESEEQERRNLDGFKNLQFAKQAMVLVSDSLSKEEDSVVKVAKESEKEREKPIHSDGYTKCGDAESEAREELKSERAEVESKKESEEQERRLQSAKQAMVVVLDSSSEEEDSVVKLALPKESVEEREKLIHSDGCTKGGDAESEAREVLKSERDDSPAEVKSTKESEEQKRSNLDANDGCKNLQSTKQAMIVVSDSSSKEEDSVVKLALPKESEEERGKLIHSDGCTKGGDAESEAREVLKSERDDSPAEVRDDSPAEVKSTKESEEQKRRNLDANDGCKNLQSTKQAVVVVSDSSSKEEDSVVKLALPKESEVETEKLTHSDGCTKGGDAESETREVLKSERDYSPAEVKSTNESEEQKRRNLDANDGCKNLQSAKQAMFVVSGSLSKEEDSMVKLALPKESEDEGENIDHSDGCTNGGVAESEAREDMEEHDSVKTSTNEGAEGKVDKQAPLLTVVTLSQVESKEQEIGQEEEPDWKQLFSKGMGDREKTLLTEYTATLRKYKDTKKRLEEVEANNQNILFEIMLQLKELKSTNAMKDEEIRSLHQKLSLLQTSIGENNSTDNENPTVTKTSTQLSLQDEEVGPSLVSQSPTTSAIEEKFRMNIDALLEENLEFWFRFSTAFHEVQKFETGVKDLVAEVSKLAERQKQEESIDKNCTLKSDVRPLYKHLTEIQNELNLWVESSVLLKEELKKRFSSLCEIEEEITKALKASAEEDDFSFTSYQAVKFQGEILNMKQENNRVADELQAGSDHVAALQIEIERSLTKLSDDWDLSGSKVHQNSPLQQSRSWSGVPLRSFIFGAKLKKEKTSIFSYVHPTLHRKFNSTRAGSTKK
ncbi:hypothetical protein V6N12_076259 [Hibiscus sabdariffa]|uniref:NAB domain-containing protein n=1 Tax=Hibiscus sabdariffa TaxID=183260 RepID=A0ABR2ACK2_9ROSI